MALLGGLLRGMGSLPRLRGMVMSQQQLLPAQWALSAMVTREYSVRTERQMKKDNQKVRNLKDGNIPWKTAQSGRYRDLDLPQDHLDYDRIYQNMTRPHFQDFLSFAPQSAPGTFSASQSVGASAIPAVLDTRNLNAHVTPLLAEQALSDVMEMPSNELNTDAFNKAIYSNGMINRADLASKAFDIMMQKDVKPNEITIASLMNAHANSGNLEATLVAFNKLETFGLVPNVYHHSVLIKAFVGGGRLDAAFRLLAQMKHDGIYIGQPVYSMLISGCTQKGLYEKAWEVYDSLVRDGREVIDEVTYTSMIYVCAKTQRVEKAMLLLEEMYKNQRRPTEVTYNMIIYACSSRKDTYLQGFDILNQMRSHGFVPDIKTFGCLLNGCARAGDLINAYAAWQEMLARNITPNQYCYTSMMWTLANKTSFEKRKAELQAIIDRKRSWDENKHFGTFSAASKGGYENEFSEEMGQEALEEISKAMREVQELSKKAVAEQRKAEDSFLHCKDPIVLAKRLFKEMEDKRVSIDIVFLRAFLAVFVNNNLLEESLYVLEHEYPRLGFPLAIQEYKKALQLCWQLENFRLAQAFWTKMREQGVTPDAQAYMYYVHCATKARKHEHAIMLVREMLDAGLAPKSIEFEIMRKQLIDDESMWVWEEIHPLLKGKVPLRPLKEKKKYLY